MTLNNSRLPRLHEVQAGLPNHLIIGRSMHVRHFLAMEREGVRLPAFRSLTFVITPAAAITPEY